MFRHHHHRGHGCDPRFAGRGRREWGPFSVEWDVRAEGFGGGRGHGRRRMFDGGELRLLLLKLIAQAPRHGYDLIRDIEERTGGAYAPSPGVVYPTLTMLDDMGLIEEQKSEGAKKQFAITAAGDAHLAEREEEVAALMARLEALGSERERAGGGAPIRRAMTNLKIALKQRLMAAEDGDTMHRIAEILDEAAQRIERL